MTWAVAVGSFCNSITKLSRRAFSSLRAMSGNSSNLRGLIFGSGIETPHSAEQSSDPYPPIESEARTVCPARPLVSTLMVLVPCPSTIVPAETVHLYAGVIDGVPPLDRDVNVNG